MHVEVYGDDAKDMSSFINNNTIDKLLAVNVIYFLNPLRSYADEMYRIMKKGGKGVIVSKKTAMFGHSDIFINKNINEIATTFKEAGFNVSVEKVELGNPILNYTAIILVK